jgi:pimeloyl-ACP methyl ester carboxylesterase
MWDFAHAVSLLISELGYEEVDVLGVSWGGALAIEFATFYPGQLRRMVLVSTTARPILNFSNPAVLKAYAISDYGGEARGNIALMADIKSAAEKSHWFTDLYRGIALPF